MTLVNDSWNDWGDWTLYYQLKYKTVYIINFWYFNIVNIISNQSSIVVCYHWMLLLQEDISSSGFSWCSQHSEYTVRWWTPHESLQLKILIDAYIFQLKKIRYKSQFPHNISEPLALDASASVPSSEIGSTAVSEAHEIMLLDWTHKLPPSLPHQPHHNVIKLLIISSIWFIPHCNVPGDDSPGSGHPQQLCQCSRRYQTLKNSSIFKGLQSIIYLYIEVEE